MEKKKLFVSIDKKVEQVIKNHKNANQLIELLKFTSVIYNCLFNLFKTLIFNFQNLV